MIPIRLSFRQHKWGWGHRVAPDSHMSIIINCLLGYLILNLHAQIIILILVDSEQCVQNTLGSFVHPNLVISIMFIQYLCQDIDCDAL